MSNPNHYPGGSAKGGQFAPSGGGKGKGGGGRDTRALDPKGGKGKASGGSSVKAGALVSHASGGAFKVHSVDRKGNALLVPLGGGKPVGAHVDHLKDIGSKPYRFKRPR